MKAYWYDNVEGDQREPHDSGRAVSEEKLASLGVFYKHCPTIDAVDTIASNRGYRNRDQVTISPEAMGAVYEEKVKSFFSEHLHEDEEIRYILDGEGYFDVRGQEDEWIRICLVKEDMIILPAGIYHRFTTNSQNYVKAMRLFQDEPKWTPLNRGAEVDVNPHRKTYLETVVSSTAAV
ncbi:Acireductone dioxygenase ARD family [Penicillium paradoxum]|uniref:Acireductone dioxygenase ARD family n=1 Tax=Penicillium paradoxum TaxID=176176 RepID=UPI00254674FF|nr:Acireductone dioxygenase ARD family [Penicillium paradoxum]KAJ5778936.1 Acireductone dioxygenase ARD family [Penicillium paradoxum]